MDSEFTVYHGHASPDDLEACREAAGSVRHGVEWSDPVRMPERDEPFMVDNGAYSGFHPSTFVHMLDEVSKQPRDPDFVVLPDVMDDWDGTVERHRGWYEAVDRYGYDFYVVGQPPAPPSEILSLAYELQADGVFIGGSDNQWKFTAAESIDELPVHIGNPGLGPNLTYAARVADSCDTTSIVVNDYWHHLERLDSEQTLSEASHVEG